MQSVSPPSLKPCNDFQHTLLQVFPELQQLWGKRTTTPTSHRPLVAMKRLSMGGTSVSHYGPNATLLEILREQRAEKRQVQNVPPHSCISASLQPFNFGIYSIILKHHRWSISLTSVIFCSRSDFKYCWTPYCSSYPIALLWMGANAAIPRDTSCPCCSLNLQGSLSFTFSVPVSNFWWAVRPPRSTAQPAGHSGFC